MNGQNVWVPGLWLMAASVAFGSPGRQPERNSGNPPMRKPVYLEVNLNNRTVRSRLCAVRNHSIIDVFAVIEQAGKDRRIQGLLVNASDFTADRAYMWELRTVLENFRQTGKKICFFISDADLDLYCLASVADKIVMDEQGALQLFGYVWSRGFVKQTLDKFGVGVRELRYFEYKSAMESYTRDSMSDADRKQYGEYLDDIFGLTRDTIVKARFQNTGEFDAILNMEYLFSARSALERGLVDITGRKEAAALAVKEMAGTEVKTWLRYGDAKTSLMTGKAPEYRLKRGGIFSGAVRIAIVYASGRTDLERGMAARSLERTICEIPEKKSVKAIVVRINSPGGSAEAADYVAEAIRSARKRIPVVVSMGPVAASGGYWAAMYADHITVSPYTLTGSIGVIGSWFFDRGLNEKIGLSVDVLKRGDHADLFSGFILPRRDLDEAEAERFRVYILDLYHDFVDKVAAGRKMDAAQVEALARGRVYSGMGAVNAGLADSIGGILDAVRIARSLAEIPAVKPVIFDEYPKPKFIDTILLRFLTARGIPDSGVFPEADADALDVLEDLRYRISANGRAMPILPLYME
ncbi:MAG: S49 family peptidase [Treponema sp.]|jgi:protease-4|nr:S49 family peptidase [Treponema sp.]